VQNAHAQKSNHAAEKNTEKIRRQSVNYTMPPYATTNKPTGGL